MYLTIYGESRKLKRHVRYHDLCAGTRDELDKITRWHAVAVVDRCPTFPGDYAFVIG